MSDYTILGFNPQDLSVLVQWENVSPMIISLPVNSEGYILTGEELDQYMEMFKPNEEILRQQNIATGVKNISEFSHYPPIDME